MATIKKVKRKKGGVSYQINFVHPKTKKWTSRTVRCSYKDALKIKAEIEKPSPVSLISFARLLR